MDTHAILQTVFGLFGGLAVFIYGMNMMSDGLQKAAGEKMKVVLGYLTKNPILGVLAGALVTSVLQSSSATTVMVIGFVSAGLMSLPQAISVILGANIGTTMTAQLLAFKISDYIYPIVFIGFVLFFLAKNERLKNIGLTVFAFGLLFVGIETMGSVMKPLAASPVFTDLIAQVSHIPVLGVLLGTAMTVVVQSSSATIAVLQNFASQPAADGVHSAIGLAGAIPILLGDNIGTTITAILASIGQNRNAKRAAIAHSVFNITGSIVFLCIIPLFSRLVEFISPKGPELEIISRQIANAHTSFNIINTLVWLPLIWLMVRIVTFIVPGKAELELAEGEPRFLDNRIFHQPVFAMHLTSKEISRCVDMCVALVGATKKALLEHDVKAYALVEKSSGNISQLKDKIVRYISSMLASGSMTNDQSEQASGLIYVLGELERIGKRCLEITEGAAEMEHQKYSFSGEAQEELRRSFQMIEDMLSDTVDALETGDPALAQKALDAHREVHNSEQEFKANHLERLRGQNCKPEYTGPYTTLLYNITWIATSCSSIADLVMDDVKLATLSDEEAAVAQQETAPVRA